MDMIAGLVKWFNKDKGYGFINIDDEPRDIFVHFSEIQVDGFKTLQEGSKVSFELVENEKGLVAKQVTVTEEPATPAGGGGYGFGASGASGASGGPYRSVLPAPLRDGSAGPEHLNISCGKTGVHISFNRLGGKRRLTIETNGGLGVGVIERLWRSLMQYEGVGGDDAQSLRTWLRIYKALTGSPYNTQGGIPAWIGSEQARDELRVEGLLR